MHIFFQIASKKENGDGSEFNCVGKISEYAPRDFKLLLAANDETKIRTYYRTSSVRLKFSIMTHSTKLWLVYRKLMSDSSRVFFAGRITLVFCHFDFF